MSRDQKVDRASPPSLLGRLLKIVFLLLLLAGCGYAYYFAS